MSQALYRKWRPRSWEQVVGQGHVIQTLRNAVLADRVAHAYLFAGPRGTGKTTAARILAKAVNCLDSDPAKRPCNACDHCLAVNEARFLDLIEIDAASNTSVEDVRDLRDKIHFAPNQGKFKIYLIDEVHMLSSAAFNALLKTLEEPPPHAIFILATTEAYKIPATVSSRCQQHEFRRISSKEIAAHLAEIAASENLEVEQEALMLVARQATGAMRDAISMLDQLAASGRAITRQLAQQVLGTATQLAVLEVVDALIAADSAAGLDQIHQALDSGADARQFTRQIVEYLRKLILVRMGNAAQVDESSEVRARMAQHAAALEMPALLRTIKFFNQAATETRGSWQPSLPLELAFVEALAASEAPGSAEPGSGPAESVARRGGATARKSTGAARSSVPAGSAPAGAQTGSLTAQQVRSQWQAIKSAVRKFNTSTQGLLNSCSVLELKGHDLYLGFSSDTLKAIMEKPVNMQAATQGLEEVLGERLRIRCVIATDSNSIPPDVENDGMVAAAVRLGGKIVDSHDVRDIPTE